MKYIFEILLLFGPATGYALWNGRNGLVHPSYDQVKTVALIMIVCVTLVRFHALYYGVSPFIETVPRLLWWYVKAYLVAITGYGLFFPPLMNLILIRKFWDGFKLKNTNYRYVFNYIFDHLSPTAIPDKWFLKWGISWQVRIIGYATLFLASVLWFCWSSFRSLESYLH